MRREEVATSSQITANANITQFVSCVKPYFGIEEINRFLVLLDSAAFREPHQGECSAPPRLRTRARALGNYRLIGNIGGSVEDD
jgi:hypothetical protein